MTQFDNKLVKQRDELRADNERLSRKVAQLYEGAEEQRQRIQLLIAERDTARAVADQNRNLRREFESLLGTSDITTGIGIVKTLIQASQDNVELRKQVKEQKARIKRLEEALRRIANQDYRGNRSMESQIAFDALKEDKP